MTSKPLVIHITTAAMGMRLLLLNQLKAIAAAGYAVQGICADGPLLADVRASGIPVTTIGMTRSISPLQDLRALARLTRVLGRLRPAIVHTHNPKPGLLGQLAATMAGVPVVVNTIHGFYFSQETPARQRRFYIAMERLAARCSDLIFFQSREDLATALAERIGAPEKLAQLGNGIDLTRFDRARIEPARLAALRAELGLEGPGPLLGYAGRLVAEKGLHELLQALRLVLARHPQARLLLVGPSDSEKADALGPQVAERYGLARQCIFTGLRHDMPELYALMDIFVLPSYREGFPRAPMEAAALGIPCVASDIRGCREAVEHLRSGLLVPVRSVEPLAEALLRLLDDRQLARRMGEQGLQLARERFDERRLFARVIAGYAQLLEGQPPSRSAQHIKGDFS